MEPVERDTRGILRPSAGFEQFALTRLAPSPPVARFANRFWFASWAMPAGERYEQQVLVHPVVNVVFDAKEATVSGVQQARFTQVLEGCGRAMGVMFRPGGFCPLLGRPVSTIAGEVLPLPAILTEGARLERDVGSGLRRGVSDEELAALVDAALATALPVATHPREWTIGWAERAAADREIRRVEDLARIAGVSVRVLQRRFADHVGVGPK